MIVDDAVDSLKLLSSILEKAGYMIRTAERGELALCSIKSKRPSLVLLDVMMPEMDGFEVCRQLKADEKNRDIPVIFISALDDEQSKITGFKSGGVDYIPKPFRKEEVLARVGAHINLSRLQLELKKKNEELEKEIIESRQSKDRFKSMFEDSAVGMSVTNADGTVNINRAFCEILGYSEFELQNKKWQEITHPDDIQKNEEIVTSLLQGKAKRVRFEKRYVHKNGSIIWADVSSILHRDANNNSVYFITSISDITQRKQAEFALTESEDMFRKLAVSTPIAICIYQDDHWVYTNPAGEKLSGYTLEEYGQMSFWEFVAPEYQELIKTKAKERLTGISTNKGFEFRIIRKDGQPRWVYLKGSLITYRGKPAGLISVIDITEKKQMEDQLRRSEEFYRYLFENNPAPMWIYDLDTLLFLEVNEAAVFHYGYSRKEFLDMTLKDIRPEEDIDLLIENIESENDKLSRSGYWRHLKKNGEIIYVEIISHSIVFEGKSARLVISSDITERVNTQLEIQKEKQLLRTLIDNLPVSIYVKDAECRKVVANLTNVERMGYTDEAEVLGKTDLELYEGEIGIRRYNDDLLVVKNGKPIINKEEFFINPDGSCRWSLTSKIPLLDMQGKVTGIVGIGRDITEQKKASETIQKLSKGIEQSSSIIVITDIQGNIEYVNPKFFEITGYTQEEVIGQNPRILKSGETPDGKYKELWETISSGGVWRGEFHNRKKNGELYWEWATMTSIKNDNEEITNYIAIKEDISLRKQMETELVLAKEKAEQSDRLKSAFLANMSHEIRTPLNSIIGFSELLTDPGFDEGKKKDFIRYIVGSGNNLLNIINDIMDISKIESGQIAIHKTKIQVSKFLDEIRALHIMKVEERQIGFRKSCLCSGYENNIFVLADKNRLLQIFNNLIGNALKFTSEGYIEVGCRPVGNEVEFHVQDTGIGISTEFHDKIFERFRQVDFSTNRKFGGNGLGLAITKNLIELMGGRIRVESEPGKGSTFYFTLPSCQL